MSEERATELEREVFEAITGWPLDEAPDGGVDEDTAAWLATARAAMCVCGHDIAEHRKERSDGGPPFCDLTLRALCGCNGFQAAGHVV